VAKLVTFSWTVVQDESSGEMERPEVLLHRSNHGQNILESGSPFEIKEPYFTLSNQGEPTLRIDHLSDLFVCTDSIRKIVPRSSIQEVGNSEGAVSATDTTAPVEKTARECKEEGNAALKRQDLLLAYAKYTEGL